MLEFKPITLEDREWMTKKFHEANYKGCEYTFVNNFIWRESYRAQAILLEGCLVIKSGSEKKKNVTFPIGDGNKKRAIELLIQNAAAQQEPFVMRGILEEQKQELEYLFPNVFLFSCNRDESDYIYSAEKLATLTGKKLHGKRNHIARFRDGENWNYEPITRDSIAKCYKMNDKWCEINECAMHKGLRKEMCAVKQALDYFFDLKLEGGMLTKGQKVVAYSVGEPVSSDTYVVHIEKAFSDIQGAYPMINQQFVIHNCQNYMYVNREDDTGDAGLRKAKLSYYPEILLSKYNAVLAQP